MYMTKGPPAKRVFLIKVRAIIRQILFVPGDCHGPECYDIEMVHLPSVGPVEYLADFSPDVAHIRAEVERIANSGRRIVVVAHSYGGVVPSEAIQGLDLVTRPKNGQSGGVAHLFLCCSFVISKGKSVISTFGENNLPWWNISVDRLALSPISPGEIFYVSTSEVQGAVARLKPHSYQTLHSPVTYAAWKHVPTTYLYCVKDNAIPFYVQKMMVEETAKGYPH
ncbi:hypothetical protein BDV23DRAFT_195830 [Aspergillus alliaceus]|uniref:AB hydrolase-1 domain-containing protein n=1 Tax=Petromyces alliaceus TaxID=209559 RepID=A0A5N7C024_PETAA|nr:hypothetical protein BDV23DRAFT_195830 [Aspergillus alliaceus]